MRRLLPGQRGLFLLALLVIACLPAVTSWQYIFYVLDLMLIYAVFVMGLDLAMGYTGQVSLGHAAFFGIGAYTTAILSKQYGIPFWFTIPVAVGLAGAFGLIVGLTAPRLHEDYLVMSTLAFGTVAWLVFVNWRSLTGGPMGMPGIPAPSITVPGVLHFEFDSYHRYLWLLLVLFALAVLVTHRVVNSTFGRACLAIRDDEVAAEALGINLAWYKVTVFALSAAYGGIAGSFFAPFLGLVSPESFAFPTSLTVLVMNMIGGMGSIAGSILGVIVVTLFSELTRDYPVYSMMAYGFLLTAMIIYFPYGVVGGIRRLAARWRAHRAARAIEKPVTALASKESGTESV